MLKVKHILVKSVCSTVERHRVQSGSSVWLAELNSATTMTTEREDVEKWKIYIQ
jgi:hypothetical protein